VLQVKAFGSLVKGLRVGMDLLILLQNEEHVNSLLSKILYLPELSGDNGLNEFLKQFEAAIDSDFPKYQVIFFSPVKVVLIPYWVVQKQEVKNR